MFWVNTVLLLTVVEQLHVNDHVLVFESVTLIHKQLDYWVEAEQLNGYWYFCYSWLTQQLHPVKLRVLLQRHFGWSKPKTPEIIVELFVQFPYHDHFLVFGSVTLVTAQFCFSSEAGHERTGTCVDTWVRSRQQEQLFRFVRLQRHELWVKLKALVILLSALVQSQSNDHFLVLGSVTFLHEQFCCYKVAAHTSWGICVLAWSSERQQVHGWLRLVPLQRHWVLSKPQARVRPVSSLRQVQFNDHCPVALVTFLHWHDSFKFGAGHVKTGTWVSIYYLVRQHLLSAVELLTHCCWSNEKFPTIPLSGLTQLQVQFHFLVLGSVTLRHEQAS